MKLQLIQVILIINIITTNLKAQENLLHLLQTDFHQAMQQSGYYRPELTNTDHDWQLAKARHDAAGSYISEKPLIPKIIHHIWLGSPLPEKYKRFRDSWIEKHPDWHCILWTDEDIEVLQLANKKLYDATSSYGEKSDIARYEILYRYGGLYVDTDFFCLKPFDIFHHCFDFYTGIAYSGPLWLFNGLIAAAPGHPILKACIEHIYRAPGATDSFFEILNRTGPRYFSWCYKQCIDQCPRSVALPVSFFYPWPDYHRDQNKPEEIALWLRPETFAIHYWHTSWNEGKTE